ncbi:MAG: hypothetical protein J0H49_37590 [Acidobacteria bacterium]|nr:hypothetical protein [Acidobacteriota bacterium]
MARIATVVFASLAVGLWAQQAPQKDAARIKVVPRAITTSKPELQRGPGDRVYLDEQGDVIAEGATLPDGRPFTFRIKKRVHIKPQITSALRPGSAGYEYNFSVANGSGAQQWIQLFWIDVNGSIDARMAPPYWRVYNIRPMPPQTNRVYIGRQAKDDDSTGRLTAGSSTGPFTLASSWSPGLVRAQFVGYREPPSSTDKQENYESFAGNMSDWLREAINSELTQDRNSVTAYTIGPKVKPGTPGVQAVRSELQESARNAIFSLPERKEMMALASMTNESELRDGLRALHASSSGLSSQFYSALLTYLP